MNAKCRGCPTEFEVEHKSGRRQEFCGKRCRERVYRREHPDKIKELKRNQYKNNSARYILCSRVWAKKHPEKIRAYQIKRLYGITAGEYDALKSAQIVCGLCKLPFTDSNIPVLDHCHTSGKLREFIHRDCNNAIGLFKEEPIILRLAAEYIEKHRRH